MEGFWPHAAMGPVERMVRRRARRPECAILLIFYARRRDSVLLESDRTLISYCDALRDLKLRDQ